MKTVYQTEFSNLKLVRRGKVRDIYDLGEYVLFVAADRISAFDVIMKDPIPGKGALLSQISAFWFKTTNHIIANHFITNNVSDYPPECMEYHEDLENRSMLVKKCKVLPVECIVRGYVAGSGWKEYKSKGTITGIPLPTGLVEFDRLPEPIFTPSTKEDEGHDINIPFSQAEEILGKEIAAKVKEASIALYKFAAEYLEKNNLILADTKFEFGLTETGDVMLIDEALTPDSSRFWLKETYAPGKEQTNFDKQVLRDYLESINWNKQPPPPDLSSEVIHKTIDKYQEAYLRIVK